MEIVKDLDTNNNNNKSNGNGNNQNDKTQSELSQNLVDSHLDSNSQNDSADNKMRMCKHICEKKKRLCKFNAMKNYDYCVEHLAFNEQKENADKRVICPLDPKHSIYEKNFEKHLKKCNSRIKYLGDFDIKNINVSDDIREDLSNLLSNDNGEYSGDGVGVGDGLVGNDESKENSILNEKQIFGSYKELDETQLKNIIEFLVSLDKRFNLCDLQFNELNDEFIESVLVNKSETHRKHLKQISSIVSHVDALLHLNKSHPPPPPKPLSSVSSSSSTGNHDNANAGLQENEQNKEAKSTCCLIELGAGRGKLSYWFEQSRIDKCVKDSDYYKQNLSILLIERGSQRFKFDTKLKKDVEDSSNCTQFERIRIDLKDLYLNKVPMILKSDNYLLYGKHLCGIATDFSLRCLKHSLEDKSSDLKFNGIVLAVCCHHKCEWESFCGRDFLESLNIDSKMFYIIRSISSWCTCGDRGINDLNQELVFGYNRQRIGRICKNLFDYARLNYLTKSIKLPSNNYKLVAKLFYYVESDVTLENTMIYAHLEKN